MNERETADDGDIFGHAQTDIRKWLGRSVGDETRRGLGGMRDEAGAAGEQSDDDVKGRAWYGRGPESRAARRRSAE